MKKLFLFLILIVCAAAACKKMYAGEETGSGTRAWGLDPRGDVVETSKKLIALKGLSGRIEATGNMPFTQYVEYVAPDKYHVKYRDESGAELEMVMGGDKTYIKSGDSWNDVPSDTNPSPTMRNKFTDEVLNTVVDVKFEGEDTLDGKPVIIYSYKLVTKVGNFPVTQKIWVDKNSGLPVKVYEEYTDGATNTQTTTFDTTSPVAIDLPTK